jgi:hypothetical protein
MNNLKDKVNEINHHPEWSLLNNNILSIKLTTHDNNNNISVLDYELAAIISTEYENCNWNYCKTSKNNMVYVNSILFALAAFGTFSFFYHLYFRHRITSDDFALAKINFRSNEYTQH